MEKDMHFQVASYSYATPFLSPKDLFIFCSLLHFSQDTQHSAIEISAESRSGRMHNCASTLIASTLFAFLQPGLIIQVPGKQLSVGFMNMKTSVTSIHFHTLSHCLLLL